MFAQTHILLEYFISGVKFDNCRKRHAFSLILSKRHPTFKISRIDDLFVSIQILSMWYTYQIFLISSTLWNLRLKVLFEIQNFFNGNLENSEIPNLAHNKCNTDSWLVDILAIFSLLMPTIYSEQAPGPCVSWFGGIWSSQSPNTTRLQTADKVRHFSKSYFNPF